MVLIIAEKPELGRAIAAAIPGSARTEQAVIYKGDYAVIWAYGHLLTLKEPEDYDPSFKRWSLATLPLYFPDWGQKPNRQGGGRGASKSERLQQIGALLRQCDAVIHAGDPDDEGQYLIDEILRWHRYRGPVQRMNTNDTTPAALRRALGRLSDNAESLGRGWSAHARAVADLMVGVNCSRYFTLKNPDTLLTIGRVQTATLGLVVARDRAIEEHVKQSYYEITAALDVDDRQVEALYTPDKNDPELEDGRILDRSYAEQKAGLIAQTPLLRSKVTRKEVYEQPPLPFNLTELQSYCSARFGYEPTEVLNITQSLRDRHNAITYNRSDCQYLSEEQYKNAPATMETVCRNVRYRPAALDMTLHARCFDDSRISAHTAIIPQNTAVDMDKLTEQERKVYLAVCKYYMAQFLPKAKKAQTTLTAPLADGGTLKAVSTEILEPGWLALFKNDRPAGRKDEKTGPLSSLTPGSYEAKLQGTRIDEKQTKPPARYTKASLSKDMTRIARYVTDPECKRLLLEKDRDKEGENGSIGTVATRGPIIDKLVERGYFREDGKKLISTPLGRELYRILPDELKKPDMTARWWAIQEDIRQGKLPWTALPESVLATVRRVVATEYPRIDVGKVPAQYRRKSAKGGAPRAAAERSAAERGAEGAAVREVLGKCPRCGGDVVEGKAGYGCLNYKSGCRFVVWKQPKLPALAKVSISKSNVKTWLSGTWKDDAAHPGVRVSGKSVLFKTLSDRAGEPFAGRVRLTDGADSAEGAGFLLVPPRQPDKAPADG
ncbi:MAG: hypothetical protein K6G54_01325 [Oscillospiraceae bacterium]|nr:hypothetical protein [Oscillospiraceae bacterium]